MPDSERKDKANHSQLQKCSVRVAVAVLLFALLLQVSLERTDGFGVVSLESIDDGRDCARALRGVFAVHLC